MSTETNTIDLYYVTRNQILDLIPTPIDAINAMITGLKEWDEQPDCVVVMETFGELVSNDKRFGLINILPEIKRNQDYLCCGCAATSTVFELFKQKPKTTILRRNMSSDLIHFENMINSVRGGDIHDLGKYYYSNDPKKMVKWYEITEHLSHTYYNNKLLESVLPYLESGNWKEGILEYEKLIQRFSITMDWSTYLYLPEYAPTPNPNIVSF
jgi:hypothetical protein